MRVVLPLIMDALLEGRVPPAGAGSRPFAASQHETRVYPIMLPLRSTGSPPMFTLLLTIAAVVTVVGSALITIRTLGELR